LYFKEIYMAECDSQECVQALTRLQNARNAILSLCSELEQLRASAASFDALMKAMLAVASAMLALAAAALTIPILGWIAAAVFFAIAAVFAGLAVYFATRSGIINGQINQLENDLSAARQTFSNAAAEVMATCPQECWGDLNQPSCP
jgi:hypothetical protein